MKNHTNIQLRNNAFNFVLLINKKQYGGCMLISDIEKDPSILDNINDSVGNILKKLKIIPCKNKKEEILIKKYIKI